MDGNFSLLDDRWIPVSYVDGHPDEVSLRQLFEDAQKIIRLEMSSILLLKCMELSGLRQTVKAWSL